MNLAQIAARLTQVDVCLLERWVDFERSLIRSDRVSASAHGSERGAKQIENCAGPKGSLLIVCVIAFLYPTLMLGPIKELINKVGRLNKARRQWAHRVERGR